MAYLGKMQKEMRPENAQSKARRISGTWALPSMDIPGIAFFTAACRNYLICAVFVRNSRQSDIRLCRWAYGLHGEARWPAWNHISAARRSNHAISESTFDETRPMLLEARRLHDRRRAHADGFSSRLRSRGKRALGASAHAFGKGWRARKENAGSFQGEARDFSVPRAAGQSSSLRPAGYRKTRRGADMTCAGHRPPDNPSSRHADNRRSV